MFYGLQESDVTIPSGKLPYVSFGSGNKNLIIIQGLNIRDLKGAGASLALMYRLFAKAYRVYLFDRRRNVTEGITIWDLAEDIHDAMQALHIESADVFGVSQGGMIALALTLEHPKCVSKLVLGASSSRPNEVLRNAVSKWVRCAYGGDYLTINRDTFSLLYTEQYLKKYRLLIPLMVRLVKPKDLHRFAVLASSILTFDCYNRLTEIQCPVLVLGADRDLVTTGSASREIAETLNCEIYMYPEYGHAVYEEAKDFNSRIYAFLSK